MSVVVEKERMGWVDTAKAIGIVFVVLGHHHEHILYNYIYTFHMPLFFFLSGMMFKRKSDQSFVGFAAKRAQTLLVPYFIFSFALFTLWWFLGRYLDANVTAGYSLEKNFIGIFYAQGQMEYMRWGLEMWFLPCLFLTTLMYYFLASLSPFIQALVIAVSATIGFNLPSWLGFRLPWSVDIAMVALGFFWLGHLARQPLMKFNFCWKSISLLILLFLISLLAFEFQQARVDMYQAIYGDHLLFYLAAVTGTVFYVALARILPMISFVLFVGANSLVIYMLHMRALTVLNFIFGRFPSLQVDESTLSGALIVSLLQILVVLPAVFILNHYLPFLLGRGRSLASPNHQAKVS